MAKGKNKSKLNNDVIAEDTTSKTDDVAQERNESTENTSTEGSVNDDWDVVQTSGHAIPKPKNTADSEVFTLNASTLNQLLGLIATLLIGVLIGALAFGGSDDAVTESELRIALREVLADSNISSSASNSSSDYMVDDDPYIGPADAPIVIVEFSDFLCSFCGRHYQQTLVPLLERYEGYVRYVYRDFPGVGGQYAFLSAMAAECANDQGEFWAYHDTLFENQSALSTENVRENLIDFADDLSLDLPTFIDCFDSQEHLTDVQLDRADGQSIGATGTPAFLINGRFISGAQPLDFFIAYIDRELNDMGITPPAS